jgi:hypothetical protein
VVPGERELRKVWWAAIHRATLDYFSCNDLQSREAEAAQESAELWFFRPDQDALNSFDNIMIVLGEDPGRWKNRLLRKATRERASRKYLNRWHVKEANKRVISRQNGPG